MGNNITKTSNITYTTEKEPSFFGEYFEYVGDFFVGLGKTILYLLPPALTGGTITLIVLLIVRKVTKKREEEKLNKTKFNKNKELLKQALIHKSYAFENHIQSNEKLEFLGDSILEYISSKYIYENGIVNNTLIISSPGAGKTTILRDLIRILSEYKTIGVVDERGEIAAMYKGIPQNDVGILTDVVSFSSCPANKFSKMAESLTSFVIGPIWSKDDAYATNPYLDTKPYVGFNPTTPHKM